MPARLARSLIGQTRSERANRQLGLLLAFVAGALNAGGYLAVGSYTSHVTGAISTVSDQLVLGHGSLVVHGLGAVLAFLLGALCCAYLVNRARQRGQGSLYAQPLLLEAGLILLFGLMGPQLARVPGLLVPLTLLLLCFVMGLQNAVLTKASNATVRTTHMTGVVTDLGIELGRRLAGAGGDAGRRGLLLGLLLCFFGGGIVGAYGFKAIGYGFTLPLALGLALLALVPTLDDLRRPTSAETDADSCG
jgi:uncharacterized membrane protein YoaK (UPF0700 family)